MKFYLCDMSNLSDVDVTAGLWRENYTNAGVDVTIKVSRSFVEMIFVI